MRKNKALSRRNFLIGAGVLGAGATACACGVLTSAGLLMLDKPPPPILPTLAPATPRFQQPSIITRADWGALEPNHNASNENGFYSERNINGWRVYESDLAEVYQTVVVHHAAFYENTDFDTLLAVQSVHRNQRRWADIGYHYLIGKNGLIYEGRDWSVRGTHVERYNTGSLGICLLGNFMETAPEVNQLNSALALINWLGERLQLSHIASHRQFNPQTQCPGDNLQAYIEQFATSSGLTIGIEGYIPPSDSTSCGCSQIT